MDDLAHVTSAATSPRISVRNLTVGYGSYVLMRDVSFDVARDDVFLIMGGSGCGKSTLLRVLMGLKEPQAGQVLYGGTDFWACTPRERRQLMQRTGVLFQGGALWSSMTLAENVGLPLQQYTRLSAAEIREQASLKLALAGLAGFEDYYPSEISGGMRKRAGLARAMALNPTLLFFDEPSAGLDPITSAGLDRLILRMRDRFGATIVVVTHELDSVFTIADRVVMMEKTAKTIVAEGDPVSLRDHSPNPWVRAFLSRDGLKSAGAESTEKREGAQQNE